MIRLLVVDDEKIVLDSVSYMIRNSMTDIEIETARNGKEGLLKLESFKPHVVMTDIRMPGISGLELIRQARISDTTVKILIVTAFEEFEYAREAFKYDVEDYILKPLSKPKLLESLEKVIRKIDVEKARRDEELESIEKMYASMSLVESNFFQSIFLQRDFSDDLQQYRQVLSRPLVQGYLVTVEVQSRPEDSGWSQVSSHHARLSECGDYLRSHVGYRQEAIVSPVVLNRIFTYVEAPEGILSPGTDLFWNGIHDSLLKKFGLKTRIAIGPIREILEIGGSYEETLRLVRQSDRNVILWEPSPEANYDPLVIRALAERLTDQFQNRNRKWLDTLQEFRKVYWAMNRSAGNEEMLENLLMERLALIAGICRQNGCELDPILADASYIRIFHRTQSAQRLDLFENLMVQLASLWFRQSGHHLSELVRSVQERVDRDYAQELKLEDVAQEIGVTPQYLSSLFRQELGVNFKEYLTEARMTEARRMLRENGGSLKDISYAVGYNDPNYFIRQFKKVTGMTPKEYQKVKE